MEAGATKEEDLKAYLIAILKLMTDENYRVQEASCSALSKLCNDGPNFVELYLSDILEVIFQLKKNNI